MEITTLPMYVWGAEEETKGLEGINFYTDWYPTALCPFGCESLSRGGRSSASVSFSLLGVLNALRHAMPEVKLKTYKNKEKFMESVV